MLTDEYRRSKLVVLAPNLAVRHKSYDPFQLVV